MFTKFKQVYLFIYLLLYYLSFNLVDLIPYLSCDKQPYGTYISVAVLKYYSLTNFGSMLISHADN